MHCFSNSTWILMTRFLDSSKVVITWTKIYFSWYMYISLEKIITLAKITLLNNSNHICQIQNILILSRTLSCYCSVSVAVFDVIPGSVFICRWLKSFSNLEVRVIRLQLYQPKECKNLNESFIFLNEKKKTLLYLCILGLANSPPPPFQRKCTNGLLSQSVTLIKIRATSVFIETPEYIFPSTHLANNL